MIDRGTSTKLKRKYPNFLASRRQETHRDTRLEAVPTYFRRRSTKKAIMYSSVLVSRLLAREPDPEIDPGTSQ